MKLSGAGLSIALFIGILVFLMLSMLILLYQYRTIESVKQSRWEAIRTEARLAIWQSIGTEQSQTKKTYKTHVGEITTEVETTHWGVFDLSIATSSIMGDTITKMSFVGNSAKFKHSLYLADLNRPLSLTGNARIDGDVKLPKAGVKRAYIEGQRFNGTDLINGDISESTGLLPSLSSKIVKRLEDSNLSSKDQSSMNLENVMSLSFAQQEANFAFSEIVELSWQALSGKIIIQSDTSIWVAKNSILEDVILVAPLVKFEKGFSGSVQVFATDSIVVGKGVNLRYPSGLYLSNSMIQHPAIVLKEQVKVTGMVIGYSANLSDGSKYLLDIQSEATIEGVAYWTGRIDLKGKVEGATYTTGFILKTPSSVYENHIMHGELTPLSTKYNWNMPLVFDGEYSSQGIMKWLN